LHHVEPIRKVRRNVVRVSITSNSSFSSSSCVAAPLGFHAPRLYNGNASKPPLRFIQHWIIPSRDCRFEKTSRLYLSGLVERTCSPKPCVSFSSSLPFHKNFSPTDDLSPPFQSLRLPDVTSACLDPLHSQLKRSSSFDFIPKLDHPLLVMTFSCQSSGLFFTGKWLRTPFPNVSQNSPAV